MRVWILCLVVVLAGCARGPVQPMAQTPCPELRLAPVLLTVTDAEARRQQLLVHSSRESAGLTFVALDSIGAPLFSAQLDGQRLSVDRRPAYRGEDPQWLLWGWQWWQARDQLSSACVAAAGYQLQTLDDGWQVSRQGRVHWRWRDTEVNRFDLPQLGLKISVRELDAEQP